jgi:hypothetical protein
VSRPHRIEALDGRETLDFLAALGLLALFTEGNPKHGGDPTATLGWARDDDLTQPGGPVRPVISLAAKPALLHEAVVALLRSRTAADYYVDQEDLHLTKPPRDNDGKAKWGIKQMDGSQFQRDVLVPLLDSNDERRVSYALAYGCDLSARHSTRPIGNDAPFNMSKKPFPEVVADLLKWDDHKRFAEAAKSFFVEGLQATEDTFSATWSGGPQRKHANMWSDPSGSREPVARFTERVAIEALVFFPTIRSRGELTTHGFIRSGNRLTWSWPLWRDQLETRSVEILLSHPILAASVPNAREAGRLGLIEVMRCQRERYNDGKMFKFTSPTPLLT